MTPEAHKALVKEMKRIRKHLFGGGGYPPTVDDFIEYIERRERELANARVEGKVLGSNPPPPPKSPPARTPFDFMKK